MGIENVVSLNSGRENWRKEDFFMGYSAIYNKKLVRLMIGFEYLGKEGNELSLNFQLDDESEMKISLIAGKNKIKIYPDFLSQGEKNLREEGWYSSRTVYNSTGLKIDFGDIGAFEGLILSLKLPNIGHLHEFLKALSEVQPPEKLWFDNIPCYPNLLKNMNPQIIKILRRYEVDLILSRGRQIFPEEKLLKMSDLLKK